MISVIPKDELIEAFERTGGKEKPRYAKISVCWAKSQAEARRTAYEIWPTGGLSGALHTELALPAYFEQAIRLVTEDQMAEDVICGPDPGRYIATIQKYMEAGFDHISLHQIGPDQAGFIKFFQSEISPRLEKVL